MFSSTVCCGLFVAGPQLNCHLVNRTESVRAVFLGARRSESHREEASIVNTGSIGEEVAVPTVGRVGTGPEPVG